MYGIRAEASQQPQQSPALPQAVAVAAAGAVAATARSAAVTAAAAAAALPGGSHQVHPTVQQKHNGGGGGGTAPQPTAHPAAQPPQLPQPQPPQRTAESLLPPEGFSQPAPSASYGFIPDDDTDDDAAVQQPYVLHRSVKVQGRVAVAVPAAGGGGGGTAVGSGGVVLRTSCGQVPFTLPGGDPLSCASSSSGGPGGGGGGGSRMGSAWSLGGGTEGLAYGRPGSAKLAFILNGKLYDARGNELDPAAVGAVGPAAAVGAVGAAAGGGGVVVVDCGEAPPRLSR